MVNANIPNILLIHTGINSELIGKNVESIRCDFNELQMNSCLPVGVVELYNLLLRAGVAKWDTITAIDIGGCSNLEIRNGHRC